MARPLHIGVPGALYRVTARGNGWADIDLADEDRHQFLAVFGAVRGRIPWVRSADCVMTNHPHLVVETQAGHRSMGMHWANGVSTARFNRRH